MPTDARPTPQALAGTELFRGLRPAAVEAVATVGQLRRLPKHAVVFNQGEADVRAHAVVEGGVRIAQSGRDGAQIVVRFIGPGEIFGTVSLFTDGSYPADAVTVVETLEASWSETELLELTSRYPQIAINIIRIIGKRLQEGQNRVRELATQRAEQRIAHAVLRLARQAGHRTADGTAIAFPLRRKDIADIAGMTLHTASRILTRWEKAGLLTSRHQCLVLRRPSEILRISEEATD